ncbi:hypothetical protein niasHS_017547 [Heterodera schachtii]|uniref:C2H2-type domain-containing protein n=1 Tax=Heterodera schachtii TaxID=97005 RepID=A0ABD2IH31_HETSC
METRPLPPPPPPICPASLVRSDATQNSAPFVGTFSSLDQQHICVSQQQQMGQQQQQQHGEAMGTDSGLFQMEAQQTLKGGIQQPTKGIEPQHQGMQMTPKAPLQNTSLSMPNSTCAAFDYFSLFLPQQDFFHSFGDGSASSLAGEGPSNSVPSGGGPYFCEGPASSSASSASSIPTFCSTGYSSSSAKTSAASTSSSAAAKSQDRKRPYPCPTCDSRFGSKMELEEHQNSHTGLKPFQCDVCQSRFNRRSTLWNHKRIHSDAKPFKCTVCQMQFKWKNSLKCHKEMHLRKNELSQGTMPDTDSQLLTYATAAKKTMGSLSSQMDAIGAAASPSAAVLPPPAMAVLPYSAAPSRLLTCAGTPRKRAPPKSGGNGKGLKVGKTSDPMERRKDGEGTDGNGTTQIETVAEGQPTQFGINLFGIGEVAEMTQLKKESKYTQQTEEIAALRREQALQQRQHQQQPSAGFSLFPLQCVSSGGNSETDNAASVSQQQQQNFFPLGQQLPSFAMDHQHAHAHQQHPTDNSQPKQQFQPQQLDLHLGQMVDPSFLLQDFQLAQSVTVGVNGQVGMVPFLGFDLQQQLNSLATAPAADHQQMNAVSADRSSSARSSAVPASVSVIFSAPSAVPCTSSAPSSNCFTNACPSSAELLLNGYTHQQQHSQIGPNGTPFLPSVTKVQQEKNMSAEFVNDRQHIGYDLFCTTVNRGTAVVELEEFEVRNGASLPTYGQHHFTSADQFGQLGIDQQRFVHLSAGQILEGKQIKAEEQQQPPGTTVAMSY